MHSGITENNWNTSDYTIIQTFMNHVVYGVSAMVIMINLIFQCVFLQNEESFSEIKTQEM